jgi:hypothetical protein
MGILRLCYVTGVTIIELITGGIALPTLVAARSKVWVCGRWLGGIVGSNPAGGMDVCLL